MRVCHPFLLLRLCVKSNLEGDRPDAQVQMRQHRLSDDWLRSQNWPTQTDLGRRETSTSTFPTLSLVSHQGSSRQPQWRSVLQKDVLFALNIWTQQRFTYSKSYISKHSPFRFLGMIPFGKTKINPLEHLLQIFLHYLNAGSDFQHPISPSGAS